VSEVAAPVPTEKLKHPSVIEAVCELRFARGAPYSLVPGAMFERLRGQFPKSEVLPHAAFMAAVPDDIPVPPVPHHRFRGTSPNALIQTGPRLLTINILPVYPGFEDFRQLIVNTLEHYVAITDPGNPVRVGLRYINLLRESLGTGGLRDHLKISVSCPPELPQPPQETSARLVFGYGNVGTLGLSIAHPARVGEGEIGTLLDLDFFWSGPGEFPLDRFPAWLDEAHQMVYGAFISTVKENTLDVLRGR